MSKDQMLWPMWLYIWPLTLKDDLDILPLKMCSFIKYTFLLNIISLSALAKKLWSMLMLISQNSIFDLWPWRMTLTFHFYHSKCAASWDAPVHQISNVYLYWIKCYGQSESGLFDLYIWPLILKDDLDLNKLPIKMCGLSRCICMPNIKSLSIMALKLWPMLKLSSNKQTNKQGKNNMPPRPYLGGIKRWFHHVW